MLLIGAGAADRATPPCKGTVRMALIPAWARGGFSEPKPRMRQVLGNGGHIVALVFGYPLQSPAGAERGNKILWVPREPRASQSAGAVASPLTIHAQRMQGTVLRGKPVERTVPGGTGPSIIDLPAAGCWRLTLTWKQGDDKLQVRDTLDLRYGPKVA
jgi:hypothetical protein